MLAAGQFNDVLTTVSNFEDTQDASVACFLAGKAEFMRGNFKAAANSFNTAKELSREVSDEFERNLTIWHNKAQLELSVDKRAYGDINSAAFMPSSKPAVPEETKVVLEEKKPTPVAEPKQAPVTAKPAQPADTYMNEAGDIVIGTKFGWY